MSETAPRPQQPLPSSSQHLPPRGHLGDRGHGRWSSGYARLPPAVVSVLEPPVSVSASAQACVWLLGASPLCRPGGRPLLAVPAEPAARGAGSHGPSGLGAGAAWRTCLSDREEDGIRVQCAALHAGRVNEFFSPPQLCSAFSNAIHPPPGKKKNICSLLSVFEFSAVFYFDIFEKCK